MLSQVFKVKIIVPLKMPMVPSLCKCMNVCVLHECACMIVRLNVHVHLRALVWVFENIVTLDAIRYVQSCLKDMTMSQITVYL